MFSLWWWWCILQKCYLENSSMYSADFINRKCHSGLSNSRRLPWYYYCLWGMKSTALMFPSVSFVCSYCVLWKSFGLFGYLNGNMHALDGMASSRALFFASRNFFRSGVVKDCIFPNMSSRHWGGVLSISDVSEERSAFIFKVSVVREEFSLDR